MQEAFCLALQINKVGVSSLQIVNLPCLLADSAFNETKKFTLAPDNSIRYFTFISILCYFHVIPFAISDCLRFTEGVLSIKSAMCKISLSEIPPVSITTFNQLSLSALVKYFRIKDSLTSANATKQSLYKYYYSVTYSFHKNRVLKFEYVFEFCQFICVFEFCQFENIFERCLFCPHLHCYVCCNKNCEL